MVPIFFYAACAVASVGLLLLLTARAGTAGRARSARAMRGVGTVLGLAGIAWILVLIVQALPIATDSVAPVGAMALCAFISVGAAVRVITHHRPVFCALYFILVVVAGAAMYVLLAAEFVAFSLIIVYAGAILITYLFVLMLAQQSPTDVQGADAVDYDRIPREPASAVIAGFVLVAVLGGSIFGSAQAPGRTIADQQHALEEGWSDLARMPALLLEQARRVDPKARAVRPSPGGLALTVQPNFTAIVRVEHADEKEPVEVTLPLSALPDNTSRVGMALVTRFPVSLELAGVILLMAMLGAVVLARRVTHGTTTDAQLEQHS